MAVQIVVSIPDFLLKPLDELVASGKESSRASFVERALSRELRRVRIIEEIQIMRTSNEKVDDLGALSAHASRTRLELP